MNHGIYAVVKQANEWTISAGGIPIIACRDRRTAVRTVRRAAELLSTDAMVCRLPPIRDGRPVAATICGLQLPAAADPAGYDLADPVAIRA